MARASLTILNMPDVQDADELRRRPRSLHPGALSTHPCATCAGTCCKQSSVPITTVEALRIAHRWLVPLEQVVQLVESTNDAMVRLAAVPIPLSDGNVTLRLRHRAEGGCRFLQSVGSVGRCSIHAHRPGSCALYPLELMVGGKRIEVGDDDLCPSKWLKDRELERHAARAWKQWRSDVRLETRLVAQWRRHGGASLDWHAYAMFATGFVMQTRGWQLPTVVVNAGRPLGRRLW